MVYYQPYSRCNLGFNIVELLFGLSACQFYKIETYPLYPQHSTFCIYDINLVFVIVDDVMYYSECVIGLFTSDKIIDIDEMLRDCEIVTPAEVPNDLEIDIMDDEDDGDIFPVRVSSKGQSVSYIISSQLSLTALGCYFN